MRFLKKVVAADSEFYGQFVTRLKDSGYTVKRNSDREATVQVGIFLIKMNMSGNEGKVYYEVSQKGSARVLGDELSMADSLSKLFEALEKVNSVVSEIEG